MTGPGGLGGFRPTVIRFQKPWHGCVLALVAFAAFILIGRWNFLMLRRYQLVQFNAPIWIALILILVVAIVLCLVFVWPRGRLALRLRSSFSAGLLLTLFVGIGGYHQLNALLDNSRAHSGTYVIDNLDCRSGRHQSPRIWLRPLDSIDQRFSLELAKSECRRSLPGDTAYVDVKPGFFGSPWVARYRIASRNH